MPEPSMPTGGHAEVVASPMLPMGLCAWRLYKRAKELESTLGTEDQVMLAYRWVCARGQYFAGQVKQLPPKHLVDYETVINDVLDMRTTETPEAAMEAAEAVAAIAMAEMNWLGVVVHAEGSVREAKRLMKKMPRQMMKRRTRKDVLAMVDLTKAEPKTKEVYLRMTGDLFMATKPLFRAFFAMQKM